MAAPGCGPWEKPSPPGDKMQGAAALAQGAANPVLFALHTTPLLIARNLNYRGGRTCFLFKTIALADTSHPKAPSGNGRLGFMADRSRGRSWSRWWSSCGVSTSSGMGSRLEEHVGVLLAVCCNEKSLWGCSLGKIYLGRWGKLLEKDKCGQDRQMFTDSV